MDESSSKDGPGTELVLASPAYENLKYLIIIVFKVINNEIKYKDLITNLWIAKELGKTSLRVKCDSQLVTNKVKIEYTRKR